MPVTTVYLIRHGETEWNITGRWQGILDVPLNDLGREQARKLAAYLGQETIQAIYTSDLSRAVDTAQCLADVLQIVVIHDKRLRELDIGIFQGLTKPEILAKYPQELAAFLAQPYDYQIPEGESRLQLQARMLLAWRDAIAKDMEAIAIVSHGGAIKMLLSALFAHKRDFFQKQEFLNASVTLLRLDKETWEITSLAQSSYLDDEEQAKRNQTGSF